MPQGSGRHSQVRQTPAGRPGSIPGATWVGAGVKQGILYPVTKPRRSTAGLGPAPDTTLWACGTHTAATAVKEREGWVERPGSLPGVTYPQQMFW